MSDYSIDNRFTIGARVELHPGCDLWMMGARFGTVIETQQSRQVEYPRYRVDVDRTGRARWFSPSRLRAVEDIDGRQTHDHVFGPFQHSRLAGTAHRPCTIPGCQVVSLDGDDD